MQHFELIDQKKKKKAQTKRKRKWKILKMIATEDYEVVLVQYISTFWNSLYNMQIYTCKQIDMTHTNMRF